ncbi:MAG: TlyA family RNA methyltransferase [Rhizobacter sp.]|nr:TlyA family RNA methyltransferase [Burkholderiales bacterium]
MRADVLLVERGLAPSRTAAQRLIAAGLVFAGKGNSRVALSKPSASVAEDSLLEVEASELDRFVSRGGLKLDGALTHVALDVAHWRCLDVGQSTGGFTDCLLQRGAAQVVGVDVGHDQLHPRMRADVRVTCIEGVNARELSMTALKDCVAAACRNPSIAASNTAASGSYSGDFLLGFDLIVADVSFISLTKVLPQWPALLSANGRVLSLVKPQFEVGADNLARGGIVRDVSLYAVVEATIRAACAHAGLRVLDYFDSPITGTDGNREFFVYAERA